MGSVLGQPEIPAQAKPGVDRIDWIERQVQWHGGATKLIALNFGQTDRNCVLACAIIHTTLNETHEPEGLGMYGIGSGHV